VIILIWGAVELDEARPFVELDHVLKAEKVSVVEPDGNLLGQGDRLERVFQKAQTISSTFELFNLFEKPKQSHCISAFVTRPSVLTNTDWKLLVESYYLTMLSNSTGSKTRKAFK